MSLRYKVVEIGMVTDEEIEKVLNEWTAEGWTMPADLGRRDLVPGRRKRAAKLRIGL